MPDDGGYVVGPTSYSVDGQTTRERVRVRSASDTDKEVHIEDRMDYVPSQQPHAERVAIETCYNHRESET